MVSLMEVITWLSLLEAYSPAFESLADRCPRSTLAVMSTASRFLQIPIQDDRGCECEAKRQHAYVDGISSEAPPKAKAKMEIR